ncbi:MAG: SU10 major capsid protein [Candidatus Heimdallarchaeaceae archaeon]
MAAETGAFSYNDKSNRESLSNQIKDIDALETHVASTSGTVSVKNKIHSWVVDPITAQSSQAGTAELSDTSYAATEPTLLFNTTQVIEKGIAVSATNQNTDHAGFADKFAREKVKKMKEWKNQLELSAVSGSLASGTGTIARTMAGIRSFASTLVSSHASGVSLTSAMLNVVLKESWNLGSDHDTILVGAFLKQRISMFTQNTTQNIDASEFKSVGRIDIYQSDFGTQEVVKHRYVDLGAVTLNMITYIKDFVRMGVMDEVHYEDRAKTGYYKKGAIVGEYTTEVGNEGAVSYDSLLK